MQAIEGYNVIALFSGHAHYAAKGRYERLDYFMGSDGGLGRDGNAAGGFHIVHVTQTDLDVVHYRWTSIAGTVSINPQREASGNKKIYVPAPR
jgi:hypothetical protein